LAAPKLPKSVAQIFGNKIFKMIFLFLVAYMASRNVSVAIIAAVALVISMQTFSFHQANEKVQQIVEEEAGRYEEDTENIIVNTESENSENQENIQHLPVEEEERTSLLTQGENEVTVGETGEEHAKYQTMEETNVSEEGELGEYGPEGEYRPRVTQEERYARPENEESLFGDVIEGPEEVESRTEKIRRRRTNMLMEENTSRPEEEVFRPEEQLMFQTVEEEGVPKPVGELGPEEELFRPEEEARFRPEEQARFRPEEEVRFRPEEEARFRPEEEAVFRPEEEVRFRPEEEAVFRPEEEAIFRPEEEAIFRPEEEKVVRKRRSKPNPMEESSTGVGGYSGNEYATCS